MRTLVLMVTAVVTACARPTAPPVQPSTPIAAPADVPATPEPPPPLDAGTPEDAPAPDIAPDAPDDPRVALLRALGAGTARVADHVDPAQGLLVVEYVEAGPGPGARAVRRARRLCGAAIGREASLPAMFRAAMEQARHFELGCAGDACTVQGMEFAPVWRAHFAGERITALMRLSEAAMREGYLATRDAFVRGQLASQRARPCAGGAP